MLTVCAPSIAQLEVEVVPCRDPGPKVPSSRLSPFADLLVRVSQQTLSVRGVHILDLCIAMMGVGAAIESEAAWTPVALPDERVRLTPSGRDHYQLEVDSFRAVLHKSELLQLESDLIDATFDFVNIHFPEVLQTPFLAGRR